MLGLLQGREPSKVSRQIIERDELDGRVLRAPVAHEAAFAVDADDGQRSRAGMGAALGASGNVDHCLTIEERRCRGNRGRQRSRWDLSRCAGRRAGTRHPAPARIVGGCDETEPFCHGGKPGTLRRQKADDEQHATWGRADRCRTGASHFFDEILQCVYIAVPERKTDPERNAAIA
jgi:hypothetical protein